MSKFIFSSPRKYVQGSGIINELGNYLVTLGKKALIVADDMVWSLASNQVIGSLGWSALESRYECFNGEASTNEINRLVALAKQHGTDVVVGLGGGKTLDTVKAVDDILGQGVVIVPTVASTDAPSSALSVIYSDQGVFESYRFYDKNPNLVIVDTALCAQVPARLLASGIADGLATFVEAMSVKRSYAKSMVGDDPTIAGLAIAKACEKTY